MDEGEALWATCVGILSGDTVWGLLSGDIASMSIPFHVIFVFVRSLTFISEISSSNG